MSELHRWTQDGVSEGVRLSYRGQVEAVLRADTRYREGGGGDNEKGESALLSRQVPHTPEPAPLSPGRVENAAQAVRQAWQDHGSADFDTFTAEAVLRADTRYLKENGLLAETAAFAERAWVRDQALAAIAEAANEIREIVGDESVLQVGAQLAILGHVRAEFLRRIGEKGEESD